MCNTQLYTVLYSFYSHLTTLLLNDLIYCCNHLLFNWKLTRGKSAIDQRIYGEDAFDTQRREREEIITEDEENFNRRRGHISFNLHRNLRRFLNSRRRRLSLVRLSLVSHRQHVLFSAPIMYMVCTNCRTHNQNVR